MQDNTIYDALPTRGTTLDDVIISVGKKVDTTVTVPAGTTVKPGELLVTTDGGLNYTAAFIAAYVAAKADYSTGDTCVFGGFIYTALSNPAAGAIATPAVWEKGAAYVINGALMVTFERTAVDVDESFSAAVMVSGELSEQKVPQFDEEARIAAFPQIVIQS